MPEIDTWCLYYIQIYVIKMLLKCILLHLTSSQSTMSTAHELYSVRIVLRTAIIRHAGCFMHLLKSVKDTGPVSLTFVYTA